MNYTPFIRIALRYIVGGVFFGSIAMGDDLAADPDLVAAISAVVGLAVEAFYFRARKSGGAT